MKNLLLTICLGFIIIVCSGSYLSQMEYHQRRVISYQKKMVEVQKKIAYHQSRVFYYQKLHNKQKDKK